MEIIQQKLIWFLGIGSILIVVLKVKFGQSIADSRISSKLIYGISLMLFGTAIGIISRLGVFGDWILRTHLEFYLESILSYSFGWALDPYFSNTVRTVISKGFNYKKVPAEQTSQFFDPGYITQSIGFLYNKLPNVTTRLGVAFQETITSKFPFYSDDPKTTKLEKFKFDTGVESVTEALYNIEENVHFGSKLRLFSRFNELDVWDVRWDNIITAQISKYFNVNFNVLLIYEKKQSPKTQLKEALQLGITYTLF